MLEEKENFKMWQAPLSIYPVVNDFASSIYLQPNKLKSIN